MIIANHGQTRGHIIVADDASPATWHAAETLHDYIGQITGADLTIHLASRGTVGNGQAAELCVGKTGRPDEPTTEGLKNDGYILKTVGNRLFILGENDRAIVHAVYAFLEDVLGCRFFTDTVEHVPCRDYLAIGEVDRTVCSPFEYREVFGNVCYDDDEYASKRGLNGQNYRLDAAHGKSILYQGFVHTFNHFVPVFEFFDEHPEYFSMVDGKRFDGGDHKYVHGGVYVVNTQLCLTNPDVKRIVTERLRKEIEEHPEATIFSVSQNDWGAPCTCPECAKIDAEEGSYAGSLIRFVNAVAEDIAKDHPEVIIDTLAYHYSRQAPLHVKPAPNVAVRICSIECCFSHPLAECDERRPGNASTMKPTTFQEDMRSWAKLCNRMHVWDYTTNFRHYLNPMPNLHVLQKNIQFFLENGVTGLFEQGEGEDLSGEFNELRYYILSKLMWEPYGDVDRWAREFMAAYYGMGAQPIREYMDAMIKHVNENQVHVHLYDAPDKGHMPDWMIALAEEKFDEAERLADDEDVLERIRRSRMQVEYCKLYGMEKGTAEYAVAAERFIDKLKHFGFTRVREWQPIEVSYESIRKGTFE